MGTAPSATELIFLSTLSLRRATGRLAGYDAGNQNFYPRSPCGERPPRLARVVPTPIFLSTLSLRRATWACLSQSMTCVFLSTLSLRRATKPMEVPQYQILISIHALLAESDPRVIRQPATSRKFLSTLSLRRATIKRRHKKHLISHFYPRSPCGERPDGGPIVQLDISTFLSTLSLRRATNTYHRIFGEGDYFYPRSPCGERQYHILEDMSGATISIHALLAESDGARHR